MTIGEKTTDFSSVSRTRLSVDQGLFPPVVEDLMREEQVQKQLEQKTSRLAAKLREIGIALNTFE